jgi:hypothetical protein
MSDLTSAYVSGGMVGGCCNHCVWGQTNLYGLMYVIERFSYINPLPIYELSQLDFIEPSVIIHQTYAVHYNRVRYKGTVRAIP